MSWETPQDNEIQFYEGKKKEKKIAFSVIFYFFSESFIFFLYNKRSNSVVFRKNHLKFKEWRPLFGNKRHITWVKLVWKVYIKKRKNNKKKTGEKDKRISFEYIIKCILTFFLFYL